MPSTIQRQTPEWRIAKAVKYGVPREWLDDNGYIRPEFSDASEAQLRAEKARGYESSRRAASVPGGVGERAEEETP